jgi:hypothetical protein
MPVTTSKLNKLFRDFRKAGYFAKQNFWCCQSCALSAIQVSKYVFYHRQDADGIVDKQLVRPLHLKWGGNGWEICKIINDNGISFMWTHDTDKTIEILP